MTLTISDYIICASFAWMLACALGLVVFAAIKAHRVFWLLVPPCTGALALWGLELFGR
jgi:hypothetical protein